MMIFKLTASVKNYVWGGTKLRDEFGKVSDEEKLAESWELSCHHDGLSMIENSNTALVEYLAKHPEDMGENCKKFDGFPILIKLIDARDNLSIQVHPDNKYAMKHESEQGKTEMWYIIDCEPDSSIIYGFKEKITKKEFRQAIEDNTLLDKVNIVPVKKGDVFMIKAGTLHAIGKGILLAEIQQNSNTTYRVYDYGRPRELHIDKALDVTKRSPMPIPEQHHMDLRDSIESNSFPLKIYHYLLARCKYFRTYTEGIHGDGILHRNEKSFTHVLILEGEGKIYSNYDTVFNDNHSFKKGDSFFITAGSGWYINGNKCSIIYTVI
ncbi:MAG: class I mannose-6-phosphate isomerase [Ruminococcus sp.]|nr:class I mannose-6-phosphate isomerase [Ruminococcus sp.]